jgi:O-antigen/teichoic acid export membrane protein
VSTSVSANLAVSQSVAAMPSGSGRTRRLVEGALSAGVSKGAVLLSNFISIPIAIRYLGAESFGIWVTISTTLAMLLVLDLGVANSLTNFISEAYAKDDRARASTYATTALAVMTGFAALLGGAAWWIWPRLHWQNIFHLQSADQAATAARAVAAALALFLVGLPAGLGAKILGGYQELRAANLFVAAGSAFNLISILAVVRLHAGLVALVTASSAALVGANLLCLFWIWCVHKPWLFPRWRHLERSAAREIVRSGSAIFLWQLSGLVATNSDNLVLAHYLGPAQVASYSVAWRLASYAAIAQTLITPALWPALSEAFARGDLAWVRRTFRHTLWITMGSALGFALLFAAAGRSMIRVWASEAAVPTESLMLLMCAWMLISTFMSNLSNVLMAKGETRMLAWSALGASVGNLALSIFWVQRIGAPGVILATILSFAMVLVVPQSWSCRRVLRGAER